MTRPVRFSEPASEEFDEAVRWYETRRAGLGGELFDEIVATLSEIKDNPEIGTVLSSDRQTRRALVSRFPYQVVYRLRSADIVIVAIAHLKRRPGYWRARARN